MSDPKTLTKVFFDVAIKDKKVGRMVFNLFKDTPITSENFRALWYFFFSYYNFFFID